MLVSEDQPCVLLVFFPSRAYKAFHDAAKVTGAVDKDGIGSAKAHYQLAKFCDDQLKHLEAKEQSEGALDVRSCRQHRVDVNLIALM